ncbi:MAG: hypothetical protein QW568_03340 [Candidatus Anstonellaceae archaeon]
MGKTFAIAFIFALLGLAAATGPTCAAEGGSCAAKNCCTGLVCNSGQICIKPPTVVSELYAGLSQFCRGLMDLLPAAAVLMVLIGAVVYAAGQVMGAETRARANVWATAALTGALVAMLISAISPEVLKTIYGGALYC